MKNLGSRLDALEVAIVPERNWPAGWPADCPPGGHGARMDKQFHWDSPGPEFRLAQQEQARLSGWPNDWKSEGHAQRSKLRLAFDGPNGTSLRILTLATTAILWGDEVLAEEAAEAIRAIAAGDEAGAGDFAAKALRFINTPWMKARIDEKVRARQCGILRK